MASKCYHKVKDIKSKKSKEYEIEWEDGSTSWEPLLNLNCHDLLLDFEIRKNSKIIKKSLLYLKR